MRPTDAKRGNAIRAACKAAEERQHQYVKNIVAAYGTATIAAACGVSRQSVVHWKERGVVPPKHCHILEMATRGGIRCEKLHPLVFDATLIAEIYFNSPIDKLAEGNDLLLEDRYA